MARAGVQTCIYNWVKYSDRLLSEFHIFWYCPGKVWDDVFYQEIKNLGIKVILGNNHIKNYYCFRKDIHSLLKEKRYDIVHINTGSRIHTYIAVKEAYRYQVPVRIAHSHSLCQKVNRWKSVIYRELQKRTRKLCTSMFACSKEAGHSLFGPAIDIKIINNGIEIKKYVYDAAIRKK